jgi:dihydrofolate reductase
MERGQQCLKAGLLDEMILNVAPVVLGAGVRLFDNLGITPLDLEQVAVVEGIGVTHLKYRVIR